MESNFAQRLVVLQHEDTANTKVTADSADGQRRPMNPWISAESEGRPITFSLHLTTLAPQLRRESHHRNE
jgi:hypothetical protein